MEQRKGSKSMKVPQPRFFALTLLAVPVLLAAGTTARGNERGLAQVTLGKVKISIDYGRPTLKGRDPLSLISPGEIWRAGADAPSTFESSADLDFDGIRVPKGRHYLLVRYVATGVWSLLFSSRPAEAYEPRAKVAEVPVELRRTDDPHDELTIHLEVGGQKGTLRISWGSLLLASPFTVAK
jgi:Protein of unknown function (DUF2911)